MKIDQIDARILEVVQRNNQLSGEKIGEIVGLSASSVQRRINRLRRDKVIEADVSIVSPAVTGHPISMLLLVSLKHGGVRVVDHFRTAIRSAPEVMLSFYVTGEVDFVVLVTARTMEEYETFMRRFFLKHSEVKNVTTLVVLERLKVGYSTPVTA